MSFFKKLFGGEASEAKPTEEIEHKGFAIAATPMSEGGQFRVCAVITKEVDGVAKTHKLIRADVCNSADEAASISMRKAKQMIDEQGERLFN